jgi:serine/threonine-protein kinase
LALAAGTQVGSYRIEGILGRGGMAIVYSARHVEQGRRVALKLLAERLSDDPVFLARFQREGRLQASLDHPHVVTVFEAGESEHGLYLALQLVAGATLATLMHERALDAGRAVALLSQVAGALDAAHGRGLVHRDVKPQNVLVGESDDAYLGDFGLTTLGGAEGVTATGKLVGTISYLAPEVIRGAEAVSASDRYAFAALAFECLTGSVVYPRRTEAAILFAHTSEPPPRASRRRPELPQALDGVFERALSKDSGERPDTAAALVAQIAATLQAAPALGPPPPPGAAALEEPTVEPLAPTKPWARRRRFRRRPVAWLAGAALAGAVLAGVLVVTGDGDGAQAEAVPSALSGAAVLGSDLAKPGRSLACSDQSAQAHSSGCTIVQSALPGRSLVVREDGVIRRWSVRSARGELALSVVRPRGDETFQVARSRNEFVGNAGVHLFRANLAVERGDLVGLVVLPGSAAGVRPGVEGARTTRWAPSVNKGKPVTRGFANELLLRVEYARGGQQRLPKQVTGAAAADLRPGRVVKRRRLRFTSGRPVEIALVSLGARFALDQFLDGRRAARIEVPADFVPGAGRIFTFEVLAQPSTAESIDIFIRYARTDSARLLHHFYGAFPREFEFVD